MKRNLLIFASLAAFANISNGEVVLTDGFSYADGVIVGAAGSPWTTHSGTAGQADVAGQRLSLTETESEDINAPLNNAPYTVAGGQTLYAAFTVSFSSLPAGTGGYFAHFRDTGTGFRGRVFASTENAGAGSFRLGIGNSSGSDANSGQIATDLSLNTAYQVAIRYDVGTGLSTIWLDPALETDASVTASDAPGPVDISTFAFRQSTSGGNGMGTVLVDDLRVATTFAEAVPEPSTWALMGLGAIATLFWRRR